MRNGLKTITAIGAACVVALVAGVEILWYGGTAHTPHAWTLARKERKQHGCDGQAR